MRSPREDAVLAAPRAEPETEHLARVYGEALGPCVVVEDLSWPHRESVVLKVLDGSGTAWVVKHTRNDELFRQEVHAYEHWTSVLGSRAPRLVAVDAAARTFIMTFEPGRVDAAETAEVHRFAGTLTAALHGGAEPQEASGLASSLMAKAERAWGRSSRTLAAVDTAYVARAVARVEEIGGVQWVPTHGDNQPRNWLVQGSSIVMIDFGLSRRDVWVRDLLRLYFGLWRRDRVARDAFLDGYGAGLREQDRLLLDVCGTVAGITTMAWADAHGDDGFFETGRQMFDAIRADFPA